jgi:hypothetical protein
MAGCVIVLGTYLAVHGFSVAVGFPHRRAPHGR